MSAPAPHELPPANTSGDPPPPTDDEKQIMALGNLTPVQFRREIRKELEMILWLDGKSLAEISAITGIQRWQIYHDLQEVMEKWNATATDMDQVRRLALMSLRITRANILDTIEEAKASQAPLDSETGELKAKLNDSGILLSDLKRLFPVRATYTELAKLYAVAADIDKLILERFTQAQTESEAVRDAEEKATWVMDFFRENLGPEKYNSVMAGFESYYARRLAMKKAKPVG